MIAQELVRHFNCSKLSGKALCTNAVAAAQWLQALPRPVKVTHASVTGACLRHIQVSRNEFWLVQSRRRPHVCSYIQRSLHAKHRLRHSLHTKQGWAHPYLQAGCIDVYAD